ELLFPEHLREVLDGHGRLAVEPYAAGLMLEKREQQTELSGRPDQVSRTRVTRQRREQLSLLRAFPLPGGCVPESLEPGGHRLGQRRHDAVDQRPSRNLRGIRVALDVLSNKRANVRPLQQPVFGTRYQPFKVTLGEATRARDVRIAL